MLALDSNSGSAVGMLPTETALLDEQLMQHGNRRMLANLSGAILRLRI